MPRLIARQTGTQIVVLGNAPKPLCMHGRQLGARCVVHGCQPCGIPVAGIYILGAGNNGIAHGLGCAAYADG